MTEEFRTRARASGGVSEQGNVIPGNMRGGEEVRARPGNAVAEGRGEDRGTGDGGAWSYISIRSFATFLSWHGVSVSPNI